MSTLERAITIATKGHEGRIDKGGAPYILHPLRVMLAMATTDEYIVGVLHDVVEDCPGWTFERLRAEGFSETVIVALDSVTRRRGENYEDFIARASINPIGRREKLADMIDNSDLSRLGAPTARDYQRIAKYRRAIKVLTASSSSTSLGLVFQIKAAGNLAHRPLNGRAPPSIRIGRCLRDPLPANVRRNRSCLLFGHVCVTPPVLSNGH